jgi:hypothetical protein
MLSLEGFQSPSPIHRGTELWMLNAQLQPEELRRQIREMKRQGFYSFIARTYIGLSSDYPGKDFMNNMRVIVDEAGRQGLKVFVQAGYMPGGVLNLPDEYTHTAIKRMPADNMNDVNGTVLSINDKYAYVLVTKTYFLDMLNADAMKYYIKVSYEDMWRDFRDEFGKTIVSVWVDEPHFSPPDLPWTRKLPELFRQEWGCSILDNLPLLFEDTGSYRSVRYHYWRTVLKLLKNAYFTEVSEWCRANNLLFSGHLMGEDTLAAQTAYTCSAMPLYKYFDIPGIDHLTADLNWRHGHHRGLEEDHYRFLNTPLQCSSAAHQAGKEEKLCEMYGVSTQNLTFKKQKYIFDHFASLGINHKCVHGLFYSLKGRSKRAYAPHINYYQPYWEHYHALTDYQARVSWFVSQGRPAADILCLHPAEAAFMEYKSVHDDGREDRHAYGEMDRKFNSLLRGLVGIQANFELGDEDTIADIGSVDDTGKFVVGHMKYRMVIIPDIRVLRQTTVDLLKKFCDLGGRLIIMGTLPDMRDGKPDAALADELMGLKNTVHVKNFNELRILLEADPDRKYIYAGEGSSNIQINYREGNGCKYFMIFNNHEDESRKGKLVLKGNYRFFSLNALDGSCRELPVKQNEGTSCLDLAVEKGGSLLIYAKPDSEQITSKQAVPAVRQVLDLGDNWNVSANDPNVLLLEYCTYRLPDGEFSPPLTILALQHLLTKENYQGEIIIRFTFRAETDIPDVRLALEDPKEQKITFNRKDVDTSNPKGWYRDKSFIVVDLPDGIRKGENHIETTRYFKPLEKPVSSLSALYQKLDGVQLEAMYLLGDFGVYGKEEPTDTNCIRYNRDFIIGKPPVAAVSELTSSGFPFFAGTISMKKEIVLDDIPKEKRIYISLDKMDACLASVYLNGRHAGNLYWDPLKLDITDLVMAGKNTIEIKLTNTLRNLLGPYHRPVGEVGYCWSGYESPNDPWLGEYSIVTGEIFPDWHFKRDVDTTAWTDSYLQVPFGLKGVKILFE